MGKTIAQLNSGNAGLDLTSLLPVWNNGATQNASVGAVSAAGSFLKIAVNPAGGSSQVPYSRCKPDVIPTGGPDLDMNLTFDMDEIGTGYFEVNCRAVFIGSPPIAFINEPAAGVCYGTSTVRRLEIVENTEGRPSFTGVALLAGYVRVAEEITSITLPHSNFTDNYEPLFFYGQNPDCGAKYGLGWTTDPNDCGCLPPPGWSSSSSEPPPAVLDPNWGHMVDINVTLNVGEAAEPVGLRWCSSDGNPTTIIGGRITAQKLNYLPPA